MVDDASRGRVPTYRPAKIGMGRRQGREIDASNRLRLILEDGDGRVLAEVLMSTAALGDLVSGLSAGCMAWVPGRPGDDT